ncbi:hypothetical protein CRENBAI_024517 [Crenichthys baileyi]|uniref:Uncharacterized protein n=1 Tax=Crenichthys baileyi TaxID=28760 RepID=A0AAV9RVZ3_9TELE
MWRQQVKQRLDAAEEQRHEILDAAFSPEDRLLTLELPADVQQTLLIKEETSEESSVGVDQQDPEPLDIKEEQEELWISLDGEQLNLKEECDTNRCPLTAVTVKSEDDEEKPHHHDPTEIRDLPTYISANQVKADLNSQGDVSNSSETEVSEETEDEDVNCPDSRSETEDSEDDWKESRSQESVGNPVDKHLSCSECDCSKQPVANARVIA